MDIKFNKVLFDLPYDVDLELAQRLGYAIQYKKLKQKTMYVPSTSNHGFARLEGVTLINDVPAPNTEVNIFNQTSKLLVWSYKSDSEGKYNIINLSPSVKYFMVALDKDNAYNAVVQSSLNATVNPYTNQRS